jgi:2-keto-4-pentenoate hydratase
MDAPSPTLQNVARRLDAAMRTRVPIPPVTEWDEIPDITAAYAVQLCWTQMRIKRGEKVLGHNVGLTSKVAQQQIGVDQPDYGRLWQSSFYESRNGSVEIAAGNFLQPRIEGEVAFLIGKSLRGPDITPEQVLAATEACALGVEIVDSRIANWKITVADTVADNASYGGFSHGPWDKKLRDADLSAVEMSIHQNGALAAKGLGSAVLGSPVNSTAWLASKLSEFGLSLEPGDIVISGTFMRMLPLKSGDVFVFALTGQPELTVTFS